MIAGQELSFMDTISISVIGILLVFTELALLSVFVWILSKVVSKIDGYYSKKNTAEIEPISTLAGIPETESLGKLDLVNVDEDTAAMVMAVVSDHTKIPLNRLLFRSIKKLED